MQLKQDISLNTIFITHLKQTHLMPNIKDQKRDSDIESVAFSQFNIAQSILQRPDHIVLEEGLTVNYDSSFQMLILQKINKALYIFPNGFPNSYDKLNESQKSYLAQHSASTVLFYLGLIPAVYKTIEYEREKRNIAKILKYSDTPLVYIPEVFEPRERQAIYWAKQAAIQANNSKVIIVYGGLHDFAARIKLINDSSIVF